VSWLPLLSLLLKLALAVSDIVRERKQMAAGEAVAIRTALEISHARVEKARAARRSAADGVSGDDPYLRD
jgi:hypothetical protein